MNDSPPPSPPRPPRSWVLGDVFHAFFEVLRSSLPVLGYLYLARVICLAVLFLLAMPLLSWWGPLRSLTAGAFDVATFTRDGMFRPWFTLLKSFLATVVFQLAAGALVTVTAAYHHGFPDRYPGAGKEPSAQDDCTCVGGVAGRAMVFWYWLCSLAVLFNAAWMAWASSAGVVPAKGCLPCWFLTSSGAVGGLVLMFFTPAARITPFSAFKHWLFSRGTSYSRFEDDRKTWPWVAQGLHALHKAGLSMAGILEEPGQQDEARLVKGQAETFWAAATTVAGVLIVMLGSGPGRHSLSHVLPAMAFVYVITVLWAYILSALSYFFDLYRVPLLFLLTVFFGVMTLWRESDHFYPVQAIGKPAQATDSSAREKTLPPPPNGLLPLGQPARVLGLRARKANHKNKTENQKEDDKDDPAQPLVVLTLAGGGIQAAAWPLQALARLENQFHNKGGVTQPLHDSVVLISGVSGGSVGAMYYTEACTQTSDKAFTNAAAAAKTSSLCPLVSASLRDDSIKTVAPVLLARPYGFSVLRDRGLALERTFRTAALKHDLHALADASLSGWSRDALKKELPLKNCRPALIMNATVVENGKRMAFSTVPCSRELPGAVEFTSLYHADIGIATAARLSSTFPFISPAARPILASGGVRDSGPMPDAWVMPGPDYDDQFPKGGSYLHLVDGGYFEVSAVAGAMAWLTEACEQLADLGKYYDPDTSQPADAPGPDGQPLYEFPRKLAILQLSGFPVPDPQSDKAVDAGEASHGTLFDIISPPLAAIGIRDSVQLAFASGSSRQFEKRWREKRKMTIINMQVRPVISPEAWKQPPWKNAGFLSQNPPLSWHLRACERQGVDEQVEASLAGSGPYKDADDAESHPKDDGGLLRPISLKEAKKRLQELFFTPENKSKP